MTKKVSSYCFLIFIAIFFACKKSRPPVITAKPEDDLLSIPLGIVNFEFNVSSESALRSLTVYHFKNSDFQIQDTMIYTSDKEFTLLFRKNFMNIAVPGDEVVFKVVAVNQNGESSTLLKKVVFSTVENAIVENQFIYSHDNTIYNGYSLSSFSTITLDSSDISNCDIHEFIPTGDTLFSPEIVNYTWTSPNGGLFAPIAGSFYETDINDLPVIFENSSFGNTTGILSEGDVIIFKSNTEDYYLLLLKDIYQGPLGGRYSFDVRY
jgi:hypothetical protein